MPFGISSRNMNSPPDPQYSDQEDEVPLTKFTKIEICRILYSSGVKTDTIMFIARRMCHSHMEFTAGPWVKGAPRPMSETKKRLVKGYATIATLTGIATFATHLNAMQKSGFQDWCGKMSIYDASLWVVPSALHSVYVGAFWPITIPTMMVYICSGCRESE